MTLAPNTRLGPYEVVAPLGAGGMGEVYRARDTRLGRDVAIKALPSEVANDPERRARFEREARAIAALDHPHICAIYDVGEANGTHYLVMPLLDGQTLDARLAKSALPLDQALAIAGQIADALDKAHRQGIVHRDLKPANVMLTKASAGAGGAPQAKLLDFGLAKLRAPGGPVTLSATGTAATAATGTAEGTILGTLRYMAPEQVEGKEADARSDIWALGAVLYEMVTGVRPFQGDTAASVIGSILKDQPPAVSARQPMSPPLLDRVVGRCLEKDPELRWQSAADVGHALPWTTGPTEAVSFPTSGTRRPWLVGAAALVAGIGAGLVASSWREPAPPAVRDVRFSVLPEPGWTLSAPLGSVVGPMFALSPDGRHLAYVAESPAGKALWSRTLDSLTARELPGTDQPQYPFWSPDSTRLGFFSLGKLKVVGLAGGTPDIRADTTRDVRGGAWAADGTILFSRTSSPGFTRLGADGSAAHLFAELPSAVPGNDRFPSMLPDGRHFAFSRRSSTDTVRGLYLAAIDGGTATRLLDGDFSPVALNDHLLYVRGRTLMAAPIDPGQQRTTGEPVVLLENVGSATNGSMSVSVAHNGTLAYAEPWPTTGSLQWFTRAGRAIGAPIAPEGDYVEFNLSPDGTRVAMSRADPQTSTADIWLIDDRGITTRLTTDRMNDAGPIWSPDGRRLLFRSNRRGNNDLFVKDIAATRPEEPYWDRPAEPGVITVLPAQVSNDGRYIVFTSSGAASSFDIWVLPTDSLQPRPVVQTTFDEYHAALSPDGRWLAYASEESGIAQVWVQSFPDGQRRLPVSAEGGSEPRWSADGRELYFLRADRMLMTATVSGRDTLTIGRAQELFPTRAPVVANPYRRHYAVAADGRFLINMAPLSTRPPAIHVVLDWRALLAAKP